MNHPAIDNTSLALACLLVLVALFVSQKEKLGLHKDILWSVTRAVVQLDNGGYGYSYIAGRDKAHAELCALADALLQQPEHGERLQQQLIAPLAALQHEQRQLRARAIAASRVDFFTLVRGD